MTQTLFELRCEKTVFGVSDQVRHKPGYTTKEDDKRLEILDLGSRGIELSKGADQLHSYCTAQLICAFVFAFAKSRFSHDAAHFKDLNPNGMNTVFGSFHPSTKEV